MIALPLLTPEEARYWASITDKLITVLFVVMMLGLAVMLANNRRKE